MPDLKEHILRENVPSQKPENAHTKHDRAYAKLESVHTSSGAARGRVKFHPFPLFDPGALFRFELSSTTTFHYQKSMKINNLQALEGPCRVCNGQF